MVMARLNVNNVVIISVLQNAMNRILKLKGKNGYMSDKKCPWLNIECDDNENCEDCEVYWDAVSDLDDFIQILER